MRVSLVGDHEFSEIRLVKEVKVVPYSYGDAVSNVVSIPVEAGTLVTGVGHLITEGFTGGTPTIQIGDGTSGSCFSGSAANGTALNTFNWSTNTKHYPSTGKIDVTLSSGLTAGKGKVMIESLKLAGNWRQPDL